MPLRSRHLHIPALLVFLVFLVACGGGGGGGTGPDTGFNPSANTTVSGSVTYPSVNIPAGVTVTVSGDAVITVTGDYTQAGTVTAPCHALTLLVNGAVVLSGTVRNECADPTALGAVLKIVGKTSYRLSGAHITSSGAISIVNDPADAISETAALARVRAPGEPRPAATSHQCTYENTDINQSNAPDGDAINPNGRPGHSTLLGCGFLISGSTGGSVLLNNLVVNGSDGGAGKDATSGTSATGGDGGPPGAVNFIADVDIDLIGSVTINGGDGGRGGNATATGASGNPGVSVTATGGKGGDLKPKNFDAPVRFEAAGAISQTGSLNINLGTAGAGGNATATGGAGSNADPGATGGNAAAIGGLGGNTTPVTMHATGAVTLSGTVTLGGGDGGAGGSATHTPGKGGDGISPGAAGGIGGNASGRGGNGGKGQTNGALIVGGGVANLALNSKGGKAGDAVYSGGNGGDGVGRCPPPGGAGGKGGDASGGGGDRGTGSPVGAVATVSINGFGNGGTGKTGDGPGGSGGTNSVILGSGAPGNAPATNSFVKGPDGGTCPPAIGIASSGPNTPSIQQGASSSFFATVTRFFFTGNILVVIKDQGGTIRGSFTISGPTGLSGSGSFSVPSGETIGNRNWTIVISGASGPSVPTVSGPFPINVTAAVVPAPVVDLELNDLPHTGNLVSAGTYTIPLKVSGVVRGSVMVSTVGASGNHFWSNSAPAGLRWGMGNGAGYKVMYGTATVDGSPYPLIGLGVCLINATGMDATHPGSIIQRNGAGTNIKQDDIFSLPNGGAGPLCSWTPLFATAASGEIVAPTGSGRFLDMQSLQLWRGP